MLLLLAAVGPAAAGLIVGTSATLGVGAAQVTTCGDVSAAKLTYDVDGGNVIAVSVSGLPATCNGAQLRVALTTTAAAATAGPVTVSGGRAFLYLNPTPAHATVTGARLALVG